ncbi:NAD(P)H-dependent oxidoreductase subunit E [Phreatobacter sp.]|uniref:NAD(P)H-dependent oxidoreductase subunit E n=1 Tax=Phreatobacter sp. TaxID=1966341 RepID=UPI003F7306FF
MGEAVRPHAALQRDKAPAPVDDSAMTVHARPDKDRLARPKGRPLDETALAAVRSALGAIPRRRDLLIEHLHALQDRYGCLHARHLKALAEDLRLSEAEVFEVASFYHHFDIVKEGGRAPPAVTVRVCTSVSCMLAGGEDVLREAQALADPARVRVVAAPCMGRCAGAPAAMVGQRAVEAADAPDLLALAGQGATRPSPLAPVGLSEARAGGAYRLLADCLAGRRTADELIALLSDAGLRGLGGAGFPVGRKWAAVRAQAAPRLMTVNADEGEPGTFKDRHVLETEPHRMLEGALLAAWAVGAERIVIYLRDEYPAVRQMLLGEIAALEAARLAAVPIELRRGAGAYICGEESAMLESIEGRRGLPRHRPPYIAEAGLFGRPTLNHNVETLHWIRAIVENGPDWFAAQGRRGAKGLRAFSVSGRVRAPGVKIAPAGITARELIEDHCEGMAEGHELAGYLPGGASGGILPASLADEPLDFGSLDRHGCFVGSHAVVVFSQQDDVRAIARNLMAFFRDESCGQCTPCRLGTAKMGHLIEDEGWDEALIGDLEQVMRDGSICGLGQAAPNPVRSVLRFFAGGPDE